MSTNHENERSAHQRKFEEERRNLASLYARTDAFPDASVPIAPPSVDGPVFVGSVTLLVSPHVNYPVPALVTRVHDIATDETPDATGMNVKYEPQKQRIDVVFVHADSEHALPFRILHVEKVIHRADAERACLLADGHTQNLVNITYYLAITEMRGE